MKKRLCVNCGAPLPMTIEYTEQCRCDYCGEINVIVNQEHFTNDLLDKAIEFRDNYEFQDALDLYEEILREDPQNYQAVWGRLSCKYGVVYVEDEAGVGALTCHKLVNSNIAEDEDYTILKEAHWIQKQLQLKKDVEKISRIQNEIKRLREASDNSYDIFICYKQSAHDGATADSYDAEYLYYLLRKEGYRVFFAKKSLKNKAGVQYEAAIFNAISTSKVMIVFGSEPEYFTSTWVKSEWQRYLAYVKDGTDRKVIIPVYRKMQVKQLPEKLRVYQAINFDVDEKKNFMELRKRINELVYSSAISSMEAVESVDLDDKTKKAILMLASQDGDIRQMGYKNEDTIGELDKSDNAYAAYLLGCIYYGQGNNLEARRYFERARDNGIPEAREQLSFMQEYGVI